MTTATTTSALSSSSSLQTFDAIDTLFARFTALGPMVHRIALGIVFLAHAYAKAAMFTFPGTEKFFEANGFPGFLVYPVFAGELLGGLALIAGFRTRAASIALIPIMLGALVPHVKNGFFFMAPNGGWEYPAFVIVALIAQTFLGGGALSLTGKDPAKAPA